MSNRARKLWMFSMVTAVTGFIVAMLTYPSTVSLVVGMAGGAAFLGGYVLSIEDFFDEPY